ncbi:MAG: hypothetical protein HY746_00295 [Elusimicrobia bacterium]|nr:hypothetical protein [Elusimicrobiota bacterium]
MDEKKTYLKEKIFSAFKNNQYVADYDLCNSNRAYNRDEVKGFEGKHDWTKLDAKFLNEPGGSALSFFSEAAFRFYLPAYLIAHIDDKLPEVDVIFHLCNYFTNSNKNQRIGCKLIDDEKGSYKWSDDEPTIYGEATWWDYGSYRFSLFTLQEVEAIIEYLYYHLDRKDYDGKTNMMISEIKEALDNYWLKRLEYLKNKRKSANHCREEK